jgi:hypothetical protein
MTGPVYGFGIEVRGWRADIVTDRAETCDVLDRYLLPWLPRSAMGTHPASIVLQVSGGLDGSPFEFHADGEVTARSHCLEDVVPFLQAHLDQAIVPRLTEVVPIHAGVVSWQGAAVLIAGASHAGKSTLVAEPLGRGCIYFSDEYALIDGAGRAHPYPRALMLRNGRPEAHPALASMWNADTGRAPVPVRLVLALEYSPSAAWKVCRAGQSETLLMLLKHTPRPLMESAEIFAPLVRLASGATCYAGTRGEAADAADRILDLLGAQP